MKIQNPLSNLARILKSSPGKQPSASQSTDTFWNVLQKSAQRLAGNIAGPKSVVTSSIRRSASRIRTQSETPLRPTAAAPSQPVTKQTQQKVQPVQADAVASATPASKKTSSAALDNADALASAASVTQSPSPVPIKTQPAEKSVASAITTGAVSSSSTTSASPNRERFLAMPKTASAPAAPPTERNQIATQKEPVQPVASKAATVSTVSKPAQTTPFASVSSSQSPPPPSVTSRTVAEKTETPAKTVLAPPTERSQVATQKEPMRPIVSKAAAATVSTVSKPAQTTPFASVTPSQSSPAPSVTSSIVSEKTATAVPHNTREATPLPQQAQPSRRPSATGQVPKPNRELTGDASQPTTRNVSTVSVSTPEKVPVQASQSVAKEISHTTSEQPRPIEKSRTETAQVSGQTTVRTSSRPIITAAPIRSEKSQPVTQFAKSADNPSVLTATIPQKQSEKTTENAGVLRKLGRFWQQQMQDLRQTLSGKKAEAPAAQVKAQAKSQAEIIPDQRISQVRVPVRGLEAQTETSKAVSEPAGSKTHPAKVSAGFAVEPKSSGRTEAISATPLPPSRTAEIPAARVVPKTNHATAPVEKPLAQDKTLLKQTVETTRPAAAASSENVRNVKSEAQVPVLTATAETIKSDRPSVPAAPAQRSFWGMKVFARSTEPVPERKSATWDPPALKSGVNAPAKIVAEPKSSSPTEAISASSSHFSRSAEMSVEGAVQKANRATMPGEKPVMQDSAPVKQTMEMNRPVSVGSSANVRDVKSKAQVPVSTPNAETLKSDRLPLSVAPLQRSFGGMKVLTRSTEPVPEKKSATLETPAPKSEVRAPTALKPQVAQSTGQPNSVEMEKKTVSGDVTRRDISNKSEAQVARPSLERSAQPVAGMIQTLRNRLRRQTPVKSALQPAKIETRETVVQSPPTRMDTKPDQPATVRSNNAALRSEPVPQKNIKQNNVTVTSGNSQTSLRISPDAPLPTTPVVFSAAPRENKDVERAVQQPVSLPENKKSDDLSNPISGTATNPRYSERIGAVPVQRITPQPTEKRLSTQERTDSPGRLSDIPAMSEMPNRKTDAFTARVEPPVSVVPTPANNVAPPNLTKRSTESAPDASLASKATTAEASPAPSSPQTDGETPAASTASPTVMRETIARIESAMPSPRTRITVEQIRELQAMVSRSLQTAQTLSDGSSQATFQWAPDGLGPLRFSIVTRNDDVRIEINSGRKDVIEALEEGRGNIERMIADLGMRVEKFEVRLSASDTPDPLSPPSQDQPHPERHSDAPSEKADSSAPDLPVQETTAEAAPERRRPLAEHEWVA